MKAEGGKKKKKEKTKYKESKSPSKLSLRTCIFLNMN